MVKMQTLRKVSLAINYDHFGGPGKAIGPVCVCLDNNL